MNNDVIIVIPAYNPDEKIIEIVKSFKEYKIIVVNDGSNETKYFKEISKYCEIITNEKNEGKGNALKKAYKYIIEHYPNILGVVTVDADGQHQYEDVIKILETLKQKDQIILGVRNFNKKSVPLRSKIGNNFMNFVFYKKYNVKIIDTQTGLRGIPTRYLKQSIEIEGNKYEYEMKQLISWTKKEEIVQIPIETIYHKNLKSFFNPIRDSIRVLKSIF